MDDIEWRVMYYVPVSHDVIVWLE